jgi:hypothetical protein
MNQPNNTILVGGSIIIAVGYVNAVINNRPKTPIFAGGVGFLLLASLLDAFGGNAAKFATAIVGLATFTVLIVEGPSLIAALQNSQKGK